MSKTIPINPSALTEASATIPKDTPIFMLNLLHFHETAVYPNHKTTASSSSQSPTPTTATLTGRTAYFSHYVPAFSSIAATVSPEIQPTFLAAAMANIVVPGAEMETHGKEDTKWDVVALVRYPSFQAFRDVVESERYQREAELHRLASLRDWGLVVVVQVGVEELTME